MTNPQGPPPKLPYRSPRLTVYGGVRELTGTGGNMSTNFDTSNHKLNFSRTG